MDHPPQYDLDRFATGDDDLSIENHLEVCAQCREYIAEIERERIKMLGKLPPNILTQRVFGHIENPRPSQAPLLKWATVGALCLIAVLLATFYSSSNPSVKNEKQGQPEVKWMGSAVGLRVFARRHGRDLEIGLNGAKSGDKLRYQISVPDGQRAYAAVLAAQDQRVVPVLPDDSRSRPYEFTTRIMLPGSVVVETDTESLEVLIYVSENEFRLEELQRKIEESLRGRTRLGDLKGVLYKQRIEH